MGSSIQIDLAGCYFIGVFVHIAMNVPIYFWDSSDKSFRHVYTAYYFLGVPVAITTAVAMWLK